MAPRPGAVSRRDVVLAGWAGDDATARTTADHQDPTIRAAALGALARCGSLTAADLDRGVHDPSPIVRRAAATLLSRPSVDPSGQVDLVPLLRDDDPAVTEVACFAAGERSPSPDGVVEALVDIATGHDDPLCRESAVAALGAIGDDRGRDAVLAACRDKVTIRRRAVLALAAFDGDEVDAALAELAGDADWQVRQAAEELLAIE